LSSLLGRPRPKLRVIPIDRRDTGIPIFKVAENTSSATICLRSYTKNVLCREKNEELELTASKLKRKRKQSGGAIPILDPNDNMLPILSNKRLSLVDPNAADAENSDVESHFPVQCSSTRENALFYSESDNFNFGEENSNAVAWMRFERKWNDEDDDIDNVMGSSLPHQCIDAINIATETDNDEMDQDGDEVRDNLCPCGSGKPAESQTFVSHVWDDEKVKGGWTAEEAGILTVGELYLMVSNNSAFLIIFHLNILDTNEMNLICSSGKQTSCASNTAGTFLRKFVIHLIPVTYSVN
jgi:hypothetical protein